MKSRGSALMSSEDGIVGSDYQAWLIELKSRINMAQQKATLSVNRELIALYWALGKDILSRQSSQGWGRRLLNGSPAICAPPFQR